MGCNCTKKKPIKVVSDKKKVNATPRRPLSQGGRSRRIEKRVIK